MRSFNLRHRCGSRLAVWLSASVLWLQLGISATAAQQSSPVPADLFKAVFSAGDGLKITVYPDTLAFPNGIYRIGSDGYCDLPLVGPTYVLNRGIGELEKLLAQKYIDFLPRPAVTVRPVIRAVVVGGFQRPGLYWVEPGENLWNLIQKAGGTLREDGLKKIRWERDGEEVSDDFVSLMQRGKALSQIGFESGDQLCVTARPRQYFWDTFRSDILPVLSILVSAAASAATIYYAYELNQTR